MKFRSILLASLLLAGCSQAPGNPTNPAPRGSENPVVADPAPMASKPPARSIASALGTVQSIDAVAGTITLAHGPVEALKWPAMTMGFTATPAQIESVQVGQQVQFEFEFADMRGRITQIHARE